MPYDLTAPCTLDTVRAVLVDTRTLLTLSTWIQEDFARRPWKSRRLDEPSNRCDVFDPLACQFCLVGGLTRILGPGHFGPPPRAASPRSPLAEACFSELAQLTPAVDAYPDWTQDRTAPLSHLLVWNDVPDRTWPQVNRLLTITIDALTLALEFRSQPPDLVDPS
jgi:hypothetical protein